VSGTINLKALLDVSQIRKAAGDIESALSGISLPKNISNALNKNLEKMKSDMTRLDQILAGNITADSSKDALNTAQRILKAYSDIKVAVAQAANLSNAQLKKLFPESVAENIEKANRALEKYNSNLEKYNSGKRQKESDISYQKGRQADLQKALDAEKKKPTEDAVKQQIADAQKQYNEIQQKIQEWYSKKEGRDALPEGQKRKSSTYRQLVDDLAKAEQALEKYKTALNSVQSPEAINKLESDLNSVAGKIRTAEEALRKFESQNSAPSFETLRAELEKLGIDMSNLPQDVDGARHAIAKLTNDELSKIQSQISGVISATDKGSGAFDNYASGANRARDAVRQLTNQERELQQFQSRVEYFFGFNNSVQLLKNAVRDAIDTVKDLDKAMTETAVVTDFSVGDMWKQLPKYTDEANKLGATVKGAYETLTLFYQQGLNQNQAWNLGIETMKMARIAGLDYTNATNLMTSALRGFNMELNQVSSQRVNDVYSELAAITASDVKELGVAMSKTASLAHSANMEFETTAALLAQGVEATRESPETIGTSLKTVIARFTEVKELFTKDQLMGTDSEGQVININKIDTALQTVGIDLKKFLLGEEGLDDVLLQLSSRWNTLDLATQRYIATQAAGSRQQSRFLAMISNYSRTQELVEAAYNSTGASQKQFEKTLGSLEAKLNKLTNAWDTFTMGLANNAVIKAVVDTLTTILTVINKITGAFGDGAGAVLKFMTAISLIKAGGVAFGSGMSWITQAKGAIDKGQAIPHIKDVAGQYAQTQYGTGFGRAMGNAFIGPWQFIPLTIKKWKEKLDNSEYAKQYIEHLNPVLEQAWETGNAPEMQAYLGARRNAGIKQFVWRGGQWLSKKGFSDSGFTRGLFTNRLTRGTSMKVAQSIGKSLGLVGTEGMKVAQSLTGVVAGLSLLSTGILAFAAAIKIADLNLINAKEAQAAAEAQKSAQSQARQNQSSFKEQISTYRQLQSTLKETTKGTDAWNEALVAANENVLEMAKNWGDLGLTYSVDNETGALQLDKTSQKKVEDKLTSATNELAFKTAFTQAYANAVQGRDYERSRVTQSLSGADDLKAQNKAKASLNTANSLLDSGLSSIIDSFDGFGSAINNDLLDEKYLKGAGKEAAKYFWHTTGDMTEDLMSRFGLTREQVLSTYGNGEKLDVELAHNALGLDDVANQLAAEVEGMASKFTEAFEGMANPSESAQAFLDVLNGVENVDLSKLEGAGENMYDILTSLGYEYGTEAYDNAYTQFLNNFVEAVKTTATNEARARGVLGDKFDLLSSETQKQFGSMLSDSSKYFGRKGVNEFQDQLTALSNEGEVDADRLTQAYNSIDFSSPIRAMSQLRKMAQSTNKEIQALGQQGLKSLSDNTSALSLSSQFEYLYENILSSDENLEDLIDEFGKLDADDIYDLADSFSDLKTFLKESGVSAAALATTLNRINKNGLNPNLISGEFLTAMSKLNSFTNGIEGTIKELDSIDLGIDYGQMTDFVADLLDPWKEMMNNGEFGNAQASGIYDLFFGAGSWRKVTQQGEAMVKQEGQRLFDLLNNVVNTGDLSPIWETVLGTDTLSGKGFNAKWNDELGRIDWEITDATYQDIYDSLAGKGLSDTLIKLLIGDAANFSIDLAQIVDANGVEEALKYLIENTKGIIDQSLIDTIINQAADPVEAQRIADEYLAKNNRKTDTWTGQTLMSGIQAGHNQKDVSGEGEYVQGIAETAFVDSIKAPIDKYKEAALEYFQGTEEDLQAALKGATDKKDFLNYFVGMSEKDEADAGRKAIEAFYEAATSEVEIQRTTWNVDEMFQLTGQDADTLFAGLSEEIQKNADEAYRLVWQDQTIDIDPNILIEQYKGDLSSYVNDELDSIAATDYSETLSNAIAEGLAKFDGNLEITVDGKSITTQVTTAINGAVNKKTYTVKVYGDVELPKSLGDSTTTSNHKFSKIKKAPSSANGTYVPSYAGGTRRAKAGPALGGEEGAEIVWNKEKGYAYIIGAKGPQYTNLQPGDRVFTAPQTRKILSNSDRGATPSFAGGGSILDLYDRSSSYNGKDNKDWLNDGSSSGSSSKSDDGDKWRNEFDWLYNLMEDLIELGRDQEKLDEKYEDYLADISKTAGDLVRVTAEQYRNLYAQQVRQELAYEKRLQEMREYLAVNAQYAEYGTYNFDDQTIEIDWDKIEAILDEDLYNNVKDYVDGLEEVQDRIDKADDELQDIENDIQDLRERFIEEYISFEKRILEALVDERQKQIDELSDINDSIKDTNSNLFDAIQKSIDKQRQDRDNQKTEDEIAKKERRLAFLRQDTSTDNTVAIKELEKELSEMKQDYTDELLDQKLSLLQDQADFAAEQRERQIKLMESNLEFDQETGQLWEQIHDLLNSSVGEDGKLLNDSALVALLQKSESWESLSEVQKKMWQDDLIKDFNAAYAYVLSQNIDETKIKQDETNKLLEELVNHLVPSHSQAADKNSSGSSGGGGSGGGGSQSPNDKIPPDEKNSNHNGNYSSDSNKYKYDAYYGGQKIRGNFETASEAKQFAVNYRAARLKALQNTYNKMKKEQPFNKVGLRQQEKILAAEKNKAIEVKKILQANSILPYKTGGLATQTGLAWLDGTKSHPELVLNARDTENFIQLKDVLSDLLRGGSTTSNTTTSGDNYFSITVQAEIANDYDVERLTKKIKDEIYKDGSYRGVNVIRKIR
jgi:TP901 family phage tail tape measure protein